MLDVIAEFGSTSPLPGSKYLHALQTGPEVEGTGNGLQRREVFDSPHA